jgi:ABC-2 type transport system permease protein
MNWRRVLGVFLRYYYISRKGLHQLSDIFYWPLVDILIWGLTSYWIQSHSPIDQLTLSLLTALIFWQVTWRGSMDISTNLLQEFWNRNLVNLFSTPVKLSEWVAGMFLLGIIKLIVTILFGALMVYLLFSVQVFTIGWVFLPFALMLLVFGWSLSFLSSSLIIRYGHKVDMIAWMIAFLFEPFSAVFYPTSILPVWAQKISWCLPTTYGFEGFRQVLETGIFPIEYFWIGMGLNIVYFAIAVTIFKWMFNKSVEKGLAHLE